MQFQKYIKIMQSEDYINNINLSIIFISLILEIILTISSLSLINESIYYNITTFFAQ